MKTVYVLSRGRERALKLAEPLKRFGFAVSAVAGLAVPPAALRPGARAALVVDVTGEKAGLEKTLKNLRNTCGDSAQIIALVKSAQLKAGAMDGAADDFFVDTAPAAEMGARIRRCFARLEKNDGSVISIGRLAIDLESYEVRVAGRVVSLTLKEFELLRFLAENPGKVYSRQFLLKTIWEYDWYGGMRTVDVHIRRLRAKLSDDTGELITTVRGVGYGVAAPQPEKKKGRAERKTGKHSCPG